MPAKGKKTGGARKPARSATPSKKATSVKKAAPKRAVAPKAKPAAKVVKKVRGAVARAAKASKKAVVKATTKAAAKAVAPVRKKAPVAPAPAKPVRKSTVAAKPVTPKASLKTPAKSTAATPAASKPAAPPSVRPAAQPKPRGRRSRLRIPTDSVPTAAWFPSPESRPRPSSFIPAPPRAESAFTTAAPPASSDRLIRNEDLQGLQQAIRTTPVRVDVEMNAGRTSIHIVPDFVTIRPGDGIEWDFRYLGGTDAIAEEMIIEFGKPHPFPKGVFKSKNPGTARPHRQISGPASASHSGQEFTYTIRCINLVKTEIAVAHPKVIIGA